MKLFGVEVSQRTHQPNYHILEPASQLTLQLLDEILQCTGNRRGLWCCVVVLGERCAEWSEPMIHPAVQPKQFLALPAKPTFPQPIESLLAQTTS